MNAEFFALAFAAALNPKLLAIDLLLTENRRSRAMFLCLLLGGLTVALTIGLLDVLVLHADAIKAQGTVSASVDLAIGLLLLAAGGLLARNRPLARPAQGTSTGRGPATGEKPQKKDGWAQRVLSEPRPGLVMLVGALVGIPGASYLTALHILVTGKSSVAVGPDRRARVQTGRADVELWSGHLDEAAMPSIWAPPPQPLPAGNTNEGHGR